METVVELPSFIRSSAGVFSATDITMLINFLSHHPTEGDVIKGSGGFRKLRWARSGQGKRGGARVIYYHIATDGCVYLLLAYAKAAQENLTAEQVKRLKQAME